MTRLAPALLLLVMALGACGRQGGQIAGDAPSPVAETFEGESLRVVTRLSSAEITTADRLRLEVEAAVAPGFAPPEAPPLEKMGEFTVVDRAVGPVRAEADGRASLTTTYMLEPFLPGDYEIPPIEIVALPTAGAPDGESAGSVQAESVVTAPIAVTVASVLEGPDEEFDIAEIKPIAAAPTDWRRIALWGGVAGGVLLVTAGLVGAAVWRRTRPGPPAPPVPPHELALAAIRSLRERRLVERGEFKLFYGELSDILRRYIEDRFGLRAPERTTEEFLRKASTSGAIAADDVAHLRRFLRSCDMVKFAEDRPAPADADETAELCGFVERSIPRPAPPEVVHS